MRLMTGILTISLLSLSSLAHAVATPWQINPSKSQLTFTATQNNAPITGQFTNIKGNIHFDANQLNSSQVQIIIDSDSLSLPYKELLDTLKMQDWLDVKDFPKAEFRSNQFKKLAENQFQAQGNVTIRDKTVPITVKFATENLSPTELRIKGTTQIKRTDFGIGQGEWADTKEVQDGVKIDFKLDLTPMAK